MRPLTIALAALGLALALPAAGSAAGEVSIFYYPWYGTPALDGAYQHWGQAGHLPPTDLASAYYPSRGLYSSSDRVVIAEQMREIAEAGVGEVVVSWWGWGSIEDLRLPYVLRAARARGLRVAVQIEPYRGRTAGTLEADLAQLRDLGITRYYVYLPFAGIDESRWAALHERLAGLELLAQTGNVARAAAARFDGVYTYDILTYTGPTLPRLCARARAAGLVCAPSVGPGYEAVRGTGDPRVRPRRNGAFYDLMWAWAVRAGADRVTITSYNEWHEGTQIEPARTPAPRRLSANPVERRYSSYEAAYGLESEEAERAYLVRTALWARVFGLVATALRALGALDGVSP